MLEYVNNLKDFKLVSNFLLVKPDKAFDILIIDGPEGTKVELKLIATGEQEANHFSISGTVVKRPDNLFYFDKNSDEAMGMNQEQFASSVKASMSIKCEHPYKEGDRIYYNYNVQLSCEEENRLIETEEHGICMLVPADMLFSWVDETGEMTPVNGYVFFERDKDPSEYQTDSGLTVIQNVKGYEKHSATVISSSLPVQAYLDGGIVTNETYKKGDRIIVDRRFGYKMAYDLHAAELKNVECALQKYVISRLEEVEA
jgi:hypothetical protein